LLKNICTRIKKSQRAAKEPQLGHNSSKIAQAVNLKPIKLVQILPSLQRIGLNMSAFQQDFLRKVVLIVALA
jgi:hypothetical protein